MEHLAREPANVRVLGNAASFVSVQDSDLAIELFTRVQSLDPGNYEWPMRLGAIHKARSRNAVISDGSDLNSMFEQRGPLFVRQNGLAFEHLEHAYRLAGEDIGGFLLVEVTKTAFDAEYFEPARSYAVTMVSQDPAGPMRARQVHKGHLVLGRLALRDGDVPQAKYHLLEAVRRVGPDAFEVFGPNMALALDLLKQDESHVVVQYLELCGRFWDSPQLGDWIALVKAGRIPQFGISLVN